MRQILLILAFLLPVCAFAQLKESFNGPDITSANPWKGDVDKFIVEDGMLRLNARMSKEHALLYLKGSLFADNEWSFFIRSDYKGTSSNYFKIFLWSERADATNPGFAYFLRLGYTKNNIALCRQEGNLKPAVLAEGDALFDLSVLLYLKATLDDKGNLTLYRKSPADEEYKVEFTAKVEIRREVGYFMLDFYYSSEHSKDKFADDIHISRFDEKEQAVDTEEADSVRLSVEQESARELLLYFDQPMDVDSYSFELSGIGEVGMAYISEDDKILKLVWDTPRQKNRRYELSYAGLIDRKGRVYQGTISFVSEYGEELPDIPDVPVFAPGSVRVNEVMADPKGLLSFPETEYVELYNTTGEPIQLDGWSFYYGDKPTLLPAFTLPAFGYVVLYRSGRDIYTANPGQGLPLDKFPSALANAGKGLSLHDPSLLRIDTVTYEKAKPGVAWERSGEGWYLSTDPRGGTPGSVNSSQSVDPETPLEPEDPEGPDNPELPVNPESLLVLPGDIVFNELLPNPYPDGSEYVELYNRSDRSLSLSGLSIATRKTDGTLSTRYPLSSVSSPLDAGEYALLTKSLEGVSLYYLISSPGALHELKLPVLANTSASIVLFRTGDEVVIDEVHYSSKWHAPSIKDEKGVSLERIDPDGDSGEASNWTSASSLADYGTPGYRNSQYKMTNGSTTGIESPVFSEQTREYTICYRLDAPGYVCRAWVFDATGRRVSEICNHDLLGTEGKLVWDGLTTGGDRARTGVYIVYVELVHPGGRVRCYKEVFGVK